jgi:hypothetical protein
MKSLLCLLVFAAFAAFAQASAPSASADKPLFAFGVIGDGKADDTAAIQKAVDSGAGTLHFPRGSYRLTRSVIVDLDKTGFTALVGDGTARIVMAGEGPAFKFIGTHDKTAEPKDFKANVWDRQRMPMVDGLEFVGAHPEADGIAASGTMQLTITRTTVRDARHAVHLTVRNRNVIVSDCHFYHNTGIGVFYDNVDLHQSNITGCHISYCAGGGVVSRAGSVFNIQIGSCDIESNMTPDGQPGANVLLDCTGGSVAEVEITGCTIQHNSKSPGSANIRYIGRSKEIHKPADIEKCKSGQISITGNVLSDVRVNIHLQHARGVVITGNSFFMGYERDLVVEDSNSVVIGANLFDRNPRYDYSDIPTSNGGLVFTRSHDCTLHGLSISGVWRHSAAVLLEQCSGFNIANCSIFDCDGPGLLLKDVRDSLITGCLIRDRRPDRAPAPSVRIEGGGDNEHANNKLAHGTETTPAPLKKQ